MTFRDDQPMCPFCDDRALGLQSGYAGRLRCDGCKGLFVSAAEVEDMINQLQQAPWSLEANLVAAAPGVRKCPRCVVTMRAIQCFGIALDQCEHHGIWFDAKELPMVLETASGVDPASIEDGPQYAELGVLDKLAWWFTRRRDDDLIVPRRPKDE